MNTKVYIGTSGYSYSDWISEVYPPGTPKKDFFMLYTQIFSFSELNFSYYTMPSQRALSPLSEKSPPGFLFSIKAHKSLTHVRDTAWQDSARHYIEGILPLQEAGKLASVLFQFPYSFHYTPANRRYLDSLTDAFQNLPVHVEFRNNEWNKEPVFSGLSQRGIGYTASDNPGLEGLPEFRPVVTNDTGYVRFHGRNSDNWWKGTNTTRYDYLYTQDEISDIVPELLKMAEKSSILLVAFNNHYKGKAVENGKELIQKLAGKKGIRLVQPAS